MADFGKAIREIHSVENLAERDIFYCRLHPLSKVLVTFWYLILVMSFPKYHVTGLLLMGLYPVVMMITGELSWLKAFHRLKPLFLAVCLIGIANPFLDRRPCGRIGEFVITAGMVSMLTLMVKTGFAVFAAYILIATTTLEQICYALRKLHVPQLMVTLLLLIYRYLVLMLKEADRITQSYALRAPGQKGIRYKAWGSLAGQMLLKSMERAGTVYESMTLRGFSGEFFLHGDFVPVRQSVLYTAAWCLGLALFRWFPIV